MRKYKPEYIGKVLPTDQKKLTNFMHDQYDSFGKIYDVCKKESEQISDIKPIDCDDNVGLSVKVLSDQQTLQKISDEIERVDNSIKILDDIITAI